MGALTISVFSSIWNEPPSEKVVSFIMGWILKLFILEKVPCILTLKGKEALRQGTKE